jgi:hypothetical protein
MEELKWFGASVTPAVKAVLARMRASKIQGLAAKIGTMKTIENKGPKRI